MTKVRRIDWSPDEWIGGVDGILTEHEAAIYLRALMAIYSRGGECPNDAEYLATRFKVDTHRRALAWYVRRARASLDRLIALGKLRASPDGLWLTNGRADRELNRARERMGGAARAGIASGKARRAPMKPRWNPPEAHLETSRASNFKDLTRTSVRIITTKDKNTDLTNSTDAARDPAPDQTAPGRAPTGPDPFSHTKPPPAASPKTAERLASLAAIARAKLLKGEP